VLRTIFFKYLTLNRILLTSGSASLNIKTNGKIAIRTFSYFLLTSLFNTILGAFLAIVIHPGDATIKSDLEDLSPQSGISHRKNTLLDNFLDLGRNIIPNNIFTAFFEQVYSKDNPLIMLCKF